MFGVVLVVVVSSNFGTRMQPWYCSVMPSFMRVNICDDAHNTTSFAPLRTEMIHNLRDTFCENVTDHDDANTRRKCHKDRHSPHASPYIPAPPPDTALRAPTAPSSERVEHPRHKASPPCENTTDSEARHKCHHTGGRHRHPHAPPPLSPSAPAEATAHAEAATVPPPPSTVAVTPASPPSPPGS